MPSQNHHAPQPNPHRKVLLIGWDAADWKVIGPLLDDGKMPHLESLITRGAMGNLATLYPVLSPMLWTSIATGKRAWKHGIHGFAEPDSVNGGVRPISNLGRKCKAVWNILNQSGLQSNVVGWWPSHPAEPINGVMISDQIKKSRGSRKDRSWPLEPGSVHPAELSAHLAPLRVDPLELAGDQLLPFVPRAAEIDQKKDNRLISVANCLAECSTIHAAATATMQLEPWDFMAVYYDAIDHFSHGFMKYHPPKLDWVPDEDFELFKDVINSAYIYHDMMLGTLLKLAGDDTTVILMSDHGFHSDQLRPQHLPNEPAGPAEEHRQFGIVVMAGPGIKQDELVFGANLLDITPTILTLFDLPIGRDMDGSPLSGAFTDPPETRFVDSWENIAGDDGRHPPDVQLDPVDSQEAVQQLVDLGYIEKPDEDQAVAVTNTMRELRYNLARAYEGGGRAVESLEILEELWQKWPDEHRFGVKIFQGCLALKRVERAREVLQQIRDNKQSAAKSAADELHQLRKKWQADEKNDEELTADELQQIRKLQRSAVVNEQTFHYLEGRLLHAEGNFSAALDELQHARDVQAHNLPDLHRVTGEVCLSLQRWEQAEFEFRAMHNIDAVNPAARLGIARALLPQRRFEEALTEATAAAGLLYHQPQAHFIAGQALSHLDRFQEAAAEYQTAVSQNPVFPDAHRQLAKLYNGPLNQPQRAIEHWDFAEQSRERLSDYQNGKSLPERHEADLQVPDVATLGHLGNSESLGPLRGDEVVIVSGLPRSGTSMMMQMLVAGGIPAFVDDHRPADESNRRGYFEHKAAKRIGDDNSWVDQAMGKAVKVVAQLLPKLPVGRRYRIVFMERSLQDVVASQRRLLDRVNRDGGDLSENRLAWTFSDQMHKVREVLSRYPEHVAVLSVNYDDALQNPASTATIVNRFLGGRLNESEMAAAIEPALRTECRAPA